MRGDPKGLTVPELVIAMFITALIGASISGVWMVLSTAHASNSETYTNTQTARNTIRRIQREFRRAKLVTSVGTGAIVYWKEDSNANCAIEISELSGLVHNPEDGTLKKHRVVFPPEMDPQVRTALDYSVPLSSAVNLNYALDMIAGNARHVETLEAEDVGTFEVRSYPSSPVSKMVEIFVVVGGGEEQAVIRSAASLRAGKTDDVVTCEGHYILDNAIDVPAWYP